MSDSCINVHLHQHTNTLQTHRAPQSLGQTLSRPLEKPRSSSSSDIENSANARDVIASICLKRRSKIANRNAVASCRRAGKGQLGGTTRKNHTQSRARGLIREEQEKPTGRGREWPEPHAYTSAEEGSRKLQRAWGAVDSDETDDGITKPPSTRARLGPWKERIDKSGSVAWWEHEWDADWVEAQERWLSLEKDWTERAKAILEKLPTLLQLSELTEEEYADTRGNYRFATLRDQNAREAVVDELQAGRHTEEEPGYPSLGS